VPRILPASAQTLSGIRAEPSEARPGQAVRVTVSFEPTGPCPTAACVCTFGDGRHRDFKINQGKDMPLGASITFKIGINGFGRIGRMVFRARCRTFPEHRGRVAASTTCSSPTTWPTCCKYDSVHGRFKGDVAVDGNTLVVNGKPIRLTAVKDPAELKWNEVGADVVVECTGLFLTKTPAVRSTWPPARRR
jgi:hypothetical protein